MGTYTSDFPLYKPAATDPADPDRALWLANYDRIAARNAAIIQIGDPNYPDLDGTLAGAYAIDDGCKAEWQFNSGALTIDSQYGNTLGASSSAPTTDTTNKKQGTASALFTAASQQYYIIRDASLPGDFPFKNGSNNKTGTFCVWVRPLTGGPQWQTAMGKDAYSDPTNFAIGRDLTRFSLNANGGNNYDNNVTWVSGTWYFIVLRFDIPNNIYKMRIYVDGSGWTDETTWSLGTGLTITGDWLFGQNNSFIGVPAQDTSWNGNIDYATVFNRMITDGECDTIRQETYTFVRPPNVSTVVAPAGDHTLSSSIDRSVSKKFVLRALPGARINIPAGRTLIFNGGLDAGDYFIFNLADTTAAVRFSPGSIPYGKAMWFGINGVGCDNTGVSASDQQIQAGLYSGLTAANPYLAISGQPSFSKLKLVPGIYRFDHKVDLDPHYPTLSGDPIGTNTVIRPSVVFPSAATDLGYAPFWIGYQGGTTIYSMNQNLFAENLLIDLSDLPNPGTTEYWGMWGRGHCRRGGLNNIYIKAGNTAFPHKVGAIKFSAALYDNSGNPLATVITNEDTSANGGLGNDTVGPYIITLQAGFPVCNTLTFTAGAQSLHLDGNNDFVDVADDWYTLSCGGGQALGTNKFGIIFANPVPAGTKIYASYQVAGTADTNHDSFIGTNLNVTDCNNKYGAVLFEQNGDSANNIAFSNVNSNSCNTLFAGVYYDGCKFDWVGGEGQDWRPGYTNVWRWAMVTSGGPGNMQQGGWFPGGFYLRSSNNVAVSNTVWDAPFGGVIIMGEGFDLSQENMFSAPSQTLDLATGRMPITSCTGQYSFVVPGNWGDYYYYGAYSDGWCMVETAMMQRYVYWYTSVYTAGSPGYTTFTLSPSAVRYQWGTPPVLPAYWVTGSPGATPFIAGETVTQAGTGATGVVVNGGTSPPVTIAGMLLDYSYSGTANSSGVWTGSTSGATFAPTAAPVKNVITWKMLNRNEEYYTVSGGNTEANWHTWQTASGFKCAGLAIGIPPKGTNTTSGYCSDPWTQSLAGTFSTDIGAISAGSSITLQIPVSNAVAGGTVAIATASAIDAAKIPAYILPGFPYVTAGYINLPLTNVSGSPWDGVSGVNFVYTGIYSDGKR